MLNDVVIVIPYYKDTINNYEKISWQSLLKYYPDIPKVVVMPRGVNSPVSHESILKTEYLDPSYFRSVSTTNKYYLNKQFYKRFITYKYILLFELDCLIVKDELNYWLSQNFSYIGAPTVKKSLLDRKNRKPNKLKYFCNGGFSLRKVHDFINVLDSQSINLLNNYTWRELLKVWKIIKFTRLLYKSYKSKKLAQYFARNYYQHEDVFWSYFAKLFSKDFKNADSKNLTYLAQFAIDTGPQFVRSKINYGHPFAYHKLYAYDHALWDELTDEYKDRL